MFVSLRQKNCSWLKEVFLVCLSSSEGFNRVFPMEKLSSFSHKEVQMILCGNQSPSWTADDIINYTEPKLGYTRDRYNLTCLNIHLLLIFIFSPNTFLLLFLSPGFLRFVRVLCGMSSDERKAFLQFTTGCSTLPPGGLANLHPRLTIVRKVVNSFPEKIRSVSDDNGKNVLLWIWLAAASSSGRRHRLELPVSQHVCSLPEASWIFVRGHHERASAGRHHGERLPPQLSSTRHTEHAPPGFCPSPPASAWLTDPPANPNQPTHWLTACWRRTRKKSREFMLQNKMKEKLPPHILNASFTCLLHQLHPPPHPPELLLCCCRLLCVCVIFLLSVLSLVPGLTHSFCFQFVLLQSCSSVSSFCFIAFCFRKCVCARATVFRLFLTGCKGQRSECVWCSFTMKL